MDGLMPDLYVIPLGDLRDHQSGTDCWCNPRETELGLWLHNSMDRREHTIEKGKFHA